ncbi:McrB family protein [Corallibacter sp.]|uniref:McrB family protein n=1 Tax=Corallibacter sp. TaxID=2038084 RepID=UPI003AB87F8E
MDQRELAKGLLDFLKSLKANTNIEDWDYLGETNDAFGTPGGSWEGQKGFRFKSLNDKKEFILRSLPSSKSFIVLESYQIPGQLYNMNLTNISVYKNTNNKGQLLESYNLTAGLGRVKKDVVESTFNEFSYTSNLIFEIDSLSPNWQGLTTAILNWGPIREKVKNKIKEEKKNVKKDILISEKNPNESKPFVMYNNSPLNQILFGPPGTGKTYHTINKALSIIEDVIEEELKKETRSNLTDRFDDLLINDWENPSGQIAFVTFHQSMTYEDFIEGIKPVVTSKKKVIYDTLPGIFKNMCTIAKENWLGANSDSQDELSFEDAFNNLKDDWEENQAMKFPMKTKGKDYTIIGFTKSSIQFKKASGSIDHTLSIATLRDYFYGRRKVRTSGIGIYYPGILDKLKSYKPTVKEDKEEKKYVLIIDEINRGNVSEIFGELITLIEEDKRLGNDESIEVILPYSKESFGVPPNLYIIGTMNTADRSVEALDTALRRRFTFEEIPPDYSLKELDYSAFNYKTSQILKTINSRIEKLLDKDHAIGHSFFIIEEEKDKEQKIIKTFYKNIIPLLQEYFFGDFGKIGLVLGKGFVNKKDWDKIADAFADFDHESRGDFEERDIYEIIDYRNSNHNYKINNVDMSFDKAIQLLMKDSIA